MSRALAAAAFGAAWLAACTTTQQVAKSLGSEFVGRNSDEIFVNVGIPRAKQQLNSGDVLYEWSAEPYPFMGLILRCDVRIQTDPAGIIKRIAIFNDTAGLWDTSRCAEVFSEIRAQQK